MVTNLWTADRRLYLDSAGKAVEANDPTRRSLLVAVGNTIPLEQAHALGLVVEPTSPSKAPKPNKGKPPVANKG